MSNSDAVDRFVQLCAEISALAAFVSEGASDHFGVDPDSVDWANVGDLGHWAAKLAEISASMPAATVVLDRHFGSNLGPGEAAEICEAIADGEAATDLVDALLALGYGSGS